MAAQLATTPSHRPLFAIYGGNAFFPVEGKDPRSSGGRVSVPCPLDPDTPDEPWWTDRHASRAKRYRGSHFSHFMWPPLSKTQSGHFPTATGYGVFDPYDIGSKDQQNSIPTRFGDSDQLGRAVAVMQRNGIGSIADMVLHQRAGGRSGVYEFKGAPTKEFPDGAPGKGRWPIKPEYIRGGVDGKTIPPYGERDPVPDPWNDIPFGDALRYQETPDDYMVTEAIRWGKWMRDRLNLAGVRIDDCKGLYVPAVERFLDALGLWATGEYFTGDPVTLYWYFFERTQGRMSALDFNVHDHLQAVLDKGGSMWELDPSRLWAGMHGNKAVTFCDSPDTDNSPGQQIATSKRLGYAYMCLISQGVPWIYHRDYSTDVGCYGLGHWIDNMLWCRKHLVGGYRQRRYIDHDVLGVETLGHQVDKPGSLTALSIDPWNVREISCQTSWGPYRHLHDYTGNIPDVWTDRNGVVTFRVPSNYFWHGNSYVCLAPAGVVDGPLEDPIPTTQVFEGSADLDIAPAGNRASKIARIWCARGSTILLQTMLADDVPTGGSVAVTVHNDTDGSVGQITIDPASRVGTISGEALRDGWQTLTIEGDGLPDEGLNFKHSATYSATETL